MEINKSPSAMSKLEDGKEFELSGEKMKQADRLIESKPEIVSQINELEEALRHLSTADIDKTALMAALYYRMTGSQIKSVW